MKHSQADLYLETYQVLDLEMSRLREIQRWQASAASKVGPPLCLIPLSYLSHLEYLLAFQFLMATFLQKKSGDGYGGGGLRMRLLNIASSFISYADINGKRVRPVQRPLKLEIEAQHLFICRFRFRTSVLLSSAIN